MHKTVLLPNANNGSDAHECFYRGIVDQMVDLVTITDSAGTVLFTSNSNDRVLGRQPYDRVGRSAFEFIHPADITKVREAFDEVVRSGTPSELIEYRCRHRDGDWRTLESRAGRGLDDSGTLVVLIQTRDVTDRRAREGRQTSEDMLKAVADVSGSIARDFNDQLVILARHVGVLESARSAAVRSDAMFMRAAIDRASVLVSQLLTFSRLDDVRPAESTDVNRTLEEMAAALERIGGHGVEVTYLLGATAPQVTLGRTALEQVLVGLVAHARGTMPDGGKLTILTRNTAVPRATESSSASRTHEQVEIEITDTGVGMSPDVKSKIFEPAVTPEGAELGLHTVWAIVHRAGGRLALDSEVQRGTTVRVQLPVAHQG
jgi:PAS domain S-box-containing protein